MNSLDGNIYVKHHPRHFSALSCHIFSPFLCSPQVDKGLWFLCVVIAKIIWFLCVVIAKIIISVLVRGRHKDHSVLVHLVGANFVVFMRVVIAGII